MKATRKLIPAIVLLLVSVLMLSTASYAWFAMNDTVTATGMTVTAKSNAQYLLIDTAENKTTKTSSDKTKAATNGSLEVYPVNFVTVETAIMNGTNQVKVDGVVKKVPANTWYTANNENKNNANDAIKNVKTIDNSTIIDSNGDGVVDASDTLTKLTKDYALKNTFFLTLDTNSEDFEGNINVNFEVLTGGDNAVSVVLCAWIPQELGDPVATYYKLNNSAIAASDDLKSNTATIEDIILTSTTSLKVEVYTYVDGDSTNVYDDYLNGTGERTTQGPTAITGEVKLTFALDI